MAKLSFDDGDGVWRTIGGRRIFIRTGESLSSAMKKSGKFKLSNKKKGEVRNESKSFNDIANENKKSLTKDETREKYGKDDADLINEAKEKAEEKTIHTQSGSYSERELKERDANIKQMYKDTWEGKQSYKELNDKLEELKKDGKVSQGELDALKYDASLETGDSKSNLKADEIKEQGEQSSKKSGEIKDFVKVNDNTYLPVREGETEDEVRKSYNERQEKYRRNLEPEVSKNLRDPRRLWDQDLVDTYIEMNEKGMVNEQKDKFTRNMKNMEGKPLYSPDRIKSETSNQSKENNSNKILNKNDLSKMSWEQVVQANTKYYSDKSVYDFEGGKAGKYKYEDGWRDNGGAGVIKQSDLDRLISKKEWEEAQKQTSNYMNDKLRRKAFQKYLREHPASKITFEDFKDMRNIDK